LPASSARRTLFVLFAVVALFLVQGDDPPRRPAPDLPPVRLPQSIPARGGFGKEGDLIIGMSAAFTGPSRALGGEFYRGAQACFLDVNANGGIHGHQLVLRAYDDGYNPEPAVANTVRLIEHDRAFVLFGYVGTPTVARVLPLLRRHSDRNVLLFCPFTGAEPQRQPPYSEYVFNLRASYQQETEGLVDHFIEVGRRRIAVFYQIDAYGRSGWNGVRTALAKHGLKIVGEATYSRGARFNANMKPQVELLRRENPDAVISVGSYAACAGFIRDARDAGWDVPIANVSFVGCENLLALLREHGRTNGKEYRNDLINSQVVPLNTRSELEAVRTFHDLLNKYRHQLPTSNPEALNPTYVSFEGYLSARLLVEVLRRLPSDALADPAQLRKAAESCRGVSLGIDQPVTFGPNRHQGLDKVYYTTVENGRLVALADWSRWKK
jgi:branched-chain amino acid transport system substrate-binding protein